MATGSTLSKDGHALSAIRQAAPLGGMAGGVALLAYGVARRSWATVGVGAALAGSSLAYRAMVGDRSLAEALGHYASQRQQSNVAVRHQKGVKLARAVTINLPAAVLYLFWRDLTNLPLFMRHLEAVAQVDGLSHWVAKGPLGLRVEWEAEIINDIPGELIAWRSLPGSDVDNAGSVRFRQLPGSRGTEVIVELKYDPPAGRAGIAVAKLFNRDAEAEVREDLRHLKQLLESGEVPTTRGQPAGAGRSRMAAARGRRTKLRFKLV